MSVVRFIAAVLFLSTLSFAQAEWRIPTRNATALIEPRNVARRYCQMDAEGFRLSPDTARRIQATTTWEKVPDWNSFEVIAAFEVGTPKATPRGVLVTVTYAVLGRYENLAGFNAHPSTVTVDMQVVQQDGVWRLVAGDELATPRVLRARAYRWLRERAAAEIDPESKRTMEQAARSLQ